MNVVRLHFSFYFIYFFNLSAFAINCAASARLTALSGAIHYLFQLKSFLGLKYWHTSHPNDCLSPANSFGSFIFSFLSNLYAFTNIEAIDARLINPLGLKLPLSSPFTIPAFSTAAYTALPSDFVHQGMMALHLS